MNYMLNHFSYHKHMLKNLYHTYNIKKYIKIIKFNFIKFKYIVNFINLNYFI